MASQIIVMPPALLASILDHPETPRLIAFGSRGLHTKADSLAGVGRVLRIEIDRLERCPEISNRLSDDVFAMLLTSSRSLVALPEPLPEALVQRLLNDVEAAMVELRHLTGHERIDIAAAIEAARHAHEIETRRPAWQTSEPAAAKLLQQASELQACLQPALDVLDLKLAAYGDVVRKAGLETAVARLGLQADLGAVLQLEPVEGGFLPRIMTTHRYGDFKPLWYAMLNRLAAFQSALDAIHHSARNGRNWLEDSALLPLQATLLNGLAEPRRCGCYRTGGMIIQSPFNGERHDLAVPAAAVPAAMEEFTRCYDSRLWRDLHPLLRAGLAHCSLAGIHGFSDGNGRLARLLLLTMLIEDRLPALPLEMIFYWNRRAYIGRTDAAVRKADLLGFMQWLIEAAEKSVELGWHMTLQMAPVRDQLRKSFADGGPQFAAIAAEQSVSMVLGPDLQFVQRAMHAPDLTRYLRDAGFDSVFCDGTELSEERMQLTYSCPLARELLINPVARV
jgi:Fic/DOC family